MLHLIKANLKIKKHYGTEADSNPSSYFFHNNHWTTLEIMEHFSLFGSCTYLKMRLRQKLTPLCLAVPCLSRVSAFLFPSVLFLTFLITFSSPRGFSSPGCDGQQSVTRLFRLRKAEQPASEPSKGDTLHLRWGQETQCSWETFSKAEENRHDHNVLLQLSFPTLPLFYIFAWILTHKRLTDER